MRTAPQGKLHLRVLTNRHHSQRAKWRILLLLSMIFPTIHPKNQAVNDTYPSMLENYSKKQASHAAKASDKPLFHTKIKPKPRINEQNINFTKPRNIFHVIRILGIITTSINKSTPFHSSFYIYLHLSLLIPFAFFTNRNTQYKPQRSKK